MNRSDSHMLLCLVYALFGAQFVHQQLLFKLDETSMLHPCNLSLKNERGCAFFGFRSVKLRLDC